VESVSGSPAVWPVADPEVVVRGTAVYPDLATAAVPDYKLFFDAIPLANQPYDPAGLTGRFIGTGSRKRDDNHFVVKGDYLMFGNGNLAATYRHGRPNQTTPSVSPINFRRWKGKNEALTLTFVKPLGQWTGESRFGFNYNFIDRTDGYFEIKDPRGFAEFSRQLAEHDAQGSAHMSRGFQGARPSLYDFEADIRKLEMPALIIVGDEDERCIEPGFFLKKTLSASGLAILPKTGHAVNLEEPDLFNQLVGHFLARADNGNWLPRDPRTRGIKPP